MTRLGLRAAIACAGLAIQALADPAVVCLQTAPPVAQENPPAIQSWKETRTKPRPLAIYVLKVDLRNPRVEIAAAIAPDPDGAGPADSQLAAPLRLAEAHHLAAALNANAFGSLPGPDGKKSTDWFEGMPVTVLSWAATKGETVKGPELRYADLWTDPQGKAHIEDLNRAVPVREAVAGFSQILKGGAFQCETNGPLHPRSSVGLDSTARFMWLVAVDGRQMDYSEGMTTYELAVLMKSLGCSDAINLDGGGSTVLMAADEKDCLRILNCPSGRDAQGRVAPRPVPVLLGVKLKK